VVRQAATVAPATPQRTTHSRTAARWLRRKVWRHRAALGPFGAGCGLWVGSGICHLTSPGSWWLSVPLGVAATVTAVGPPESWHERLPDWALHVHGWVRSEYERRYAVGVGVAGTAWLAVDWWHGPTEPLTLALAAGSVGIGTARLWHRRIRHDGQVRRLRVTWRDHLADRAKLPGSVIQSIRPIEGGRAIRLRLAPGQTVDDVRRNLDRVISALGLRPRSSRIEADPNHPRRCTILVREVDAEPVWRHNGQEVGRPAAVSIVPSDDVEVEPAARIIVLPPANAHVFNQPQVVEAPRAPRIEAPASDPLLDALRAAPEGGWTMTEIVAASGRGKSTVYERVRRMVGDGSVVEVSRGRFRSAYPGAAEAFR
jgi:hypothetical protein